MTRRQDVYRVDSETTSDSTLLAHELSRIFGDVSDRLDAIQGLRGDFETGNKITMLDDEGNEISFSLPTLSESTAYVWPAADGSKFQSLSTDGSGGMSWETRFSEKSWSFISPAGAGDVFYIGGFYIHGASADDFDPSINFGVANISYASHLFIVTGAIASGEIQVTVSGTSINDTATRTTSDSEVITIADTTAADSFFETSKKWIGQVTIETTSGTPISCNYGFVKYWDNNNSDFNIAGFEATWHGGASDSGVNIEICHHKAAGWTFNAGAPATEPTPVAALQTDHVTEFEVRNDQEGAWKRTDLDTDVTGSGSEGTIIRITTTAGKTFATGNFMMRIKPI